MGRMTDQEYIHLYNATRARQWYNERWANKWAFIIGGIIVVAFAALLFGGIEADIQRSWKVVKANDFLYVDTARLKDTSFIGITLYRQVRAIGADEINKMDIPKWQKEKRILQLDTSSNARKPLIITSKLSIDADSIFKYKSSIIGTFVKRDSTTVYFEDKQLSSGTNKWYGIKPNRKLCMVDPDFHLPKGYVFADDLYYVNAINVILNGEFPMFAKRK